MIGGYDAICIWIHLCNFSTPYLLLHFLFIFNNAVCIIIIMIILFERFCNFVVDYFSTYSSTSLAPSLQRCVGAKTGYTHTNCFFSWWWMNAPMNIIVICALTLCACVLLIVLSASSIPRHSCVFFTHPVIFHLHLPLHFHHHYTLVHHTYYHFLITLTVLLLLSLIKFTSSQLHHTHHFIEVDHVCLTGCCFYLFLFLLFYWWMNYCLLFLYYLFY